MSEQQPRKLEVGDPVYARESREPLMHITDASEEDSFSVTWMHNGDQKFGVYPAAALEHAEVRRIREAENAAKNAAALATAFRRNV